MRQRDDGNENQSSQYAAAAATTADQYTPSGKEARWSLVIGVLILVPIVLDVERGDPRRELPGAGALSSGFVREPRVLARRLGAAAAHGRGAEGRAVSRRSGAELVS